MCNVHATGLAVDYYPKKFNLDPTLAPSSSTIRNGEGCIKKK